MIALRSFLALLPVLWLYPVLAAAQQRPIPPQDRPPTFKAGVTLVPITVVVRDSSGRVVTNLGRDDFQVLEDGKPRPIVEFRASEKGPVSLALLFDTSSSMRDANHTQGKAVVSALTTVMNVAGDEAALFTFDQRLREETPFTRDGQIIRDAAAKTVPWGQTSLYDALADTAKKVAERPAPRHAVIVITDGVDTSSSRTPSDVSRFASSVDVPVYIVAVAHRRRVFGFGGSGLADLASATGGEQVEASTPEQAASAIAGLMDELRQQYFLAIDSAAAPGWHRLEVKARKRNLTVRARSGYTAATQ